MEKERSHMSKTILKLSLEIIYLLTGEVYGPIKKLSNSMRPPLMVFEKDGNKKILEVTQKMIELLTGEVPIRCQDVTVSFSVEEWEYVEGDNEIMMAKQPALTSPKGSSNKNPPDRCPFPLYSWDSTQEHHKFLQEEVQKENLTEDEEDETYTRIDVQSEEEEKPPDTKHRSYAPLYSGDLQKNYKILRDYQGQMDLKVVVKEEEEELYVSGDEPFKEKEIPPMIGKDGSSNRNTPERCPCPLYSQESTKEHQDIPQEDQEENMTEYGIEDGEDEAYVRDDEERPPDTQDRSCSPLYSWALQKNNKILRDYQGETFMGIKVEVKEEEEEMPMTGDEPCKGKQIPPEITTGGPQSKYTENRHGIMSSYGDVEDADLIEDSQGASSTLFPHPGPHMADLSSNPSIHNSESLPVHSRPVSYHTGAELFPFSENGECFVKAEELITHNSSHSLTGTYSHSKYEQSFIQNCILQRQQSKWGNPYLCSECGKGFKLKSAFLRHKRTHTEEKPFSCSECGKSFSQRAHLVSHERIHTGVKPYCCSECGKCFSHKISLITHESFHTGVKPFFCSECGKQFSRKSVLILHERVHTGEKPYPCPECGKCFSQRTHLNTHRRSHTSERPFSCSECGKTYSRKSYLVDHLRTHTGVKPFSCSVCGKCFSCKSNLITHQTIHSSKKPFSCAECGKCFQTRSAFTYHKKLHAADKLPLC